jgi:hypothetical protein
MGFIWQSAPAPGGHPAAQPHDMAMWLPVVPKMLSRCLPFKVDVREADAGVLAERQEVTKAAAGDLGYSRDTSKNRT